MSDPRRVEGEQVYCHQCGNEWARAQGGITCPSCHSEFVEILDGERPTASDSPRIGRRPESEPATGRPTEQPVHPLQDHNPWAGIPDPDEESITPDHFNTVGGGRRGVTYTTRTFRIPGGHATFTSASGVGPSLFPFPPPGLGVPQPYRSDGNRESSARGPPAPSEMQDLFSAIFQTMQNGGIFGDRPVAGMGGGFTIGGTARNGNAVSPFDLLSALFSPSGRVGDAVFSQEALDRIIEQLAEQNQGSTAPGPASEQAIRSLGKKKVTEDMMGSDGTAECSICMDNVEIGSTVTELPCKHWFHGDCIVAWLKEHDTCPHCRKPITNPDERQAQGSSRSMSDRRSSSATQSTGQRQPSSPEGSRTQRTTTNLDHQNDYNSYRVNHSSAYAESQQSQPRYPSQQAPQHQGHLDGQNGQYSRSSGGGGSSSSSSSNNNNNHNNNHNNNNNSNNISGVSGWVRNRLGLG